MVPLRSLARLIVHLTIESTASSMMTTRCNRSVCTMWTKAVSHGGKNPSITTDLTNKAAACLPRTHRHTHIHTTADSIVESILNSESLTVTLSLSLTLSARVCQVWSQEVCEFNSLPAESHRHMSSEPLLEVQVQSDVNSSR